MLINSLNQLAHRGNPLSSSLRVNSRNQGGFTIVELLIVIVVIGILAAISTVAYNGIQSRANSSSVQAAVSQVAKKLAAYRVSEGVYPDQISDIDISDSGGVNYEYTAGDSSGVSTFCVTATLGGISYMVNSASISSPKEGACFNHLSGGTIPREVNLAPPLSEWTIIGSGIVYDSAANELKFTKGVSGTITSPLIRVEGPRHAFLAARSYSTIAGNQYPPDSGVHTNISYFGADKTPVKNNGGYTANGNAARAPLNSWYSYQGSFSTNSDIKYVRVNFSSSNYTSDNIIKDVQVFVRD